MGRLSVLEGVFWGFLLLFVLLHLYPPLRLFETTTSWSIEKSVLGSGPRRDVAAQFLLESSLGAPGTLFQGLNASMQLGARV